MTLKGEIKKHEKILKVLKGMTQKEWEVFRIESDPEFDKWMPLYIGGKVTGYMPTYKRNMLAQVHFPHHVG